MMDQKTYIPESTEAELTRINEDMILLMHIWYKFTFQISASSFSNCHVHFFFHVPFFFVADVSHNYE